MHDVTSGRRHVNDLIMLTACVLSALALFVLFGNRKAGGMIRISIGKAPDAATCDYSLDEDCFVSVSNDDLGLEVREFDRLEEALKYADEAAKDDLRDVNVIEIRNHGAHVLYANCPDGTCISTGTVSKTGQTICCLPHEVIVTVMASEETDPAGLDAVTW